MQGQGASGGARVAPPPRFGSLLVRRGLASREQVAAALRAQGVRAARGVHQNLGEILVEQGVVSASQVTRLLQDQDRVLMACPTCGERYNVMGSARDRAACLSDGAPLVPAREDGALGAAATLRGGTAGPVGLELGHCRILEPIGEGGMASVYKARHLGLGRYVAVKLLPWASEDPLKARRLLFEARAIASLEHPNIVKVYDVGCEQGYFFMVMQLLRGRTLEDRLGELGPPPVEESLSLMRDVALGLEAAHAQGIVHGDLKPANLMITEDGRACLMDFGLAHAREGPDDLKGCIAGTPHYMAPEQWTGRKLDGRTDLYALGVVLYQLATGQRPFEGEGHEALARQHTQEKPRSPRSLNPQVSPGLQAVLGKLLSKSPERRYADAAACRADLERLIAHEDPKALEETGRYVRCGFCETLNPPASTECKVCKESLGTAATRRIEIALRPGEKACRRCGEACAEAARACPRCRRAI
jgi:serine/threonine-protein kinase